MDSEPSSETDTEPPVGEPNEDPTRDEDGDGFSDEDGDCDDSDSSINPSAREIPGDGIDQDCDGREICLQDLDGDGFASDNEEALILSADTICGNDPNEAEAFARPLDCDDNDATVNPEGIEIRDDGIDQDCDGVDAGMASQDIDRDGFDASVDCDDNNPDLNLEDNDADGFSTCTGDCDDTNAARNPGADDIPGDGIDQNCDGSDATETVDPDPVGCADGDVEDCDGNCAPVDLIGDGVCDNYVFVYEGVAINFECSEFNFDEGDCTSSNDLDGDGADASVDCDDTDPTLNVDDLDLDGFSSCDGDCDDNDAGINPNATDIEDDGIDQNCDGADAVSSDPGVVTCEEDEIIDCNGNCAPADWVGDEICDRETFSYGGNDINLDCEDLNYDDGDCIDVVDADGDGFDETTDCNDNDPSVYPGAEEILEDGIDQDCDGGDETCSSAEVLDCNGNCVPATWVGDGFCDDGRYNYLGTPVVLDCETDEFQYDDGDCSVDIDGDGFNDREDCNDRDASIYPGAFEISNDGIDQNCADGDLVCASDEIGDCNGNCAPSEWLGDEDCDANDIDWNGVTIDLDCPELDLDDGDCALSPTDADGDGFASDEDCDDLDAEIYPGAIEFSDDGIDQDCDGSDLVCADPNDIGDCNGVCAPFDWLQDGYCDDGSYFYFGDAIDFNCEIFDYDLGDCQ
jgi:hypothetical protein